MPFEAAVTNRQRRIRLDPDKLKTLTHTVLRSAVDVLKESRARRALVSKFERRGAVDIAFVSDRQIKELNCRWRNVNAATDVLSFPLAAPAGKNGDLPFEIGQIVISVERAIGQAREYNHSLERELAFLLTHGFLHVLGFDHETKAQEKKMFALQRKILNTAGIYRNKRRQRAVL